MGDSHSCAVLTDGSVRCWGLNTRRQLGNNDNKSSNVPVTPVGLTGAAAAKVVDITLAYDHVCARMTAGNLKCWGWNTGGQLGTGGGSAGVPTDLPGLTGVKQVALRGQVWGGGASCALTSTGGVKCWGTNTSGQVGDNSLISRSTPVDVHGLTSGVVAIARTIYTSCAVLSGGGVTCWGTNYFNGLGNNTLPLRLSFPVALEALGPGSTAEIAVGGTMFLVRRVSGVVQAVGVNARGQLGNGDLDHRLALTPVQGLSAGVTALRAGTEHACALVSGGMKCWGSNANGSVGAGSAPQTSPIAVPGQTSGVSQITTGDFHSCAAPATGGVWCWGWNHYSAVGDGTTGVMNVKAPKAVVGIAATEQVKGLFAGYAHTCAILGGGALKCWGWNSHGQLGNDSTTIAPSAVAISALSSGVAQGGGGYRFTCVRLSTGKVKCHGENTYGQLGDGTTATRKLPVELSGITDAVDLAVGDFGACVVTKAGAVKCWGVNDLGTVGDGTFVNRDTPTQVLGLEAGATSVSMSGRQACALLSDKSVRCWGSNADGAFGDGLMDHQITPVTITAAP